MSNTYNKPTITTELAHKMIAGAEAKAKAMGHPFVIAVCDESGVLKALSRMDGAALFSVQIAQDKAAKRLLEYVDQDPPASSECVSIDEAREAYANSDFVTLAKWRHELGLVDN